MPPKRPKLNAVTHCQQLVRSQRKDHFLSSLFAPADTRPHLWALYAFSHELARVQHVVHEPLAGEVRLQWWRDALETGGQGHPVAEAICATIAQFTLPLAPFHAMIDAHVFDVYHDPMPSLNDLEGYAGETDAAEIFLAMLILNDGKPHDGAELAGHAGCAWALCNVLRLLPMHRAMGRVYVPADILAQFGCTAHDVLNAPEKPELQQVLGAVLDRINWHMAQMRALSNAADAHVQPSFRYVHGVAKYARRMRNTKINYYIHTLHFAPLNHILTILFK